MPTPYQLFHLTLLSWFDKHGRKDLPWQHPRSPYRVWISEIMLQQTQVKTVIPYFMSFMARFPDIKALALASEDEVLSHWSGLGYYSRARNLHKTAKIVHFELSDNFPGDLDELLKLPGIGPSTAAAIASLAFNKATAILDGNVKRVLSRYFLVAGIPTLSDVNKQLWQHANGCMPHDRCADYTQAIMDMGATCCKVKKPDCISCPLQTTCLAYLNNVVDDYPYKKPKKIIPTQKQQFLLLHNKHNLIYLERRPPIGLWGGLWCLPSIDMKACPTTYVEDTYKFHANTSQELMRIKHSFSHYHLHIVALAMQCHAKADADAITEPHGRWFNMDEISGLGLAKPVSMIINCFHCLSREGENPSTMQAR